MLASLWRVRWPLGEAIVPLLQALWVNRKYLSGLPTVPAIRHSAWTVRELDGLLLQSQDRLHAIEGKGPGLAAVSAIVGAALGIAISGTWECAVLAQKILLVAATVATASSLVCPIVLVGPLRRNAVTLFALAELSHQPMGAVEALAVKADAVAENDQRTARLANLQTASRNDLRNALILLAVWGLTLPVL